jgi:hypothetical protein
MSRMEICLNTPKGRFKYELDTLRQVAEVPHRGRTLRVVAFSDWRVQDIKKLVRFISDGPRPDLILYAGDDLRRFRLSKKNLFADLATLSTYGLRAVAGNDDLAESRKLITGQSVYPVHSCALVIGPFAVVGIEGAPAYRKDEEAKLGGKLNLG